MFEHVEAGDRLKHRDLDMLSLAVAHAHDQRSQSGVNRMQARDLVREQHRQIARPRVAINARQQRHGPGSRLDNVVIGLQAGIWAL
jgi:hypothetical protein